MEKTDAERRVVKKVKGGHGGGHGGSWKVAYADFVTAMMAFFLVMWIIGLDQNVKQAVAAYFKDPVGFNKAVEAGESAFSVGEGAGRAVRRPTTAPRGESQKQMFHQTKKVLEHTPIIHYSRRSR